MNLASLKEMFNSVVSNVTEKGKEYTGAAAEKAKAAGRLAKLTMDLNGEKESLKKAYAAIGQTYFEGNRDDAEGLLSQLCEEAEAVAERIAAMEAEIAELKAGFAPAEEEVEVSFEEVVEEAEKEAECCCEEAAECCEEAAECCCDKIEEAVEEAVEKVEEVVEDIVDDIAE